MDQVEDVYGEIREENTSLIFDAFTSERVDNNTNSIELEYMPLNEGIKENIIINENVGINRFDFWMELKGLVPEMTDYGAIILKDKKTTKDKGVIPVPFVFDQTK